MGEFIPYYKVGSCERRRYPRSLAAGSMGIVKIDFIRRANATRWTLRMWSNKWRPEVNGCGELRRLRRMASERVSYESRVILD